MDSKSRYLLAQIINQLLTSASAATRPQDRRKIISRKLLPKDRSAGTTMVIDINELIRKASVKIGVDEPTTRRCIGAILAFLQQHHGKFDFDGLILSRIEGVDVLIKEAQDDNEIPDIPKPAPGVPSSKSEGATPAADSLPVPTTTQTTPRTPATSAASSIFKVVVAVMKMFGILAILKQILFSIFGDSAVKLIEGIEDGAELSHVLSSLKINREQGIRLVRMVVDFLKEKLDSDTIDKLVNEVPAVKVFLGESKEEDLNDSTSKKED